MAVIASAEFSGVDNILPAVDANWTQLDGGSGICDVLSQRVHARTATPSRYYHATVPPSADYDVSVDLWISGTATATFSAGPMARCVVGELTGYWTRWRHTTGIQLFRYNAGVATQLGSTVTQSLSAGQTMRLRLRCQGNVISVYRNAESTPIISVTDASPITATGRAAFLTSAQGSDGPHLDNWSADTIEAGGATSLALADSTHAHTADNIALSVLGTLVVQDATHAHSADNITLTATANGTITIPAVRDWETGNLKTGQAGVQVDIRNISTGALVVRKTGQTTHATTGVCVVSDPLIIAGTTYEVVTRFADGSRGMWDYLAS